jgi:hypothetical protein
VSDAVTSWVKDSIALLRTQALDAKKRAHAASGADKDFAKGQLMGYVDALSLLQQQADAFGIARKDVGLDGFDAERDLL